MVYLQKSFSTMGSISQDEINRTPKKMKALQYVVIAQCNLVIDVKQILKA